MGLVRGDGAARAGGVEGSPLRQVRVELVRHNLVLLEDARDGVVAVFPGIDDVVRLDAWKQGTARDMKIGN